MYNYQKSIKNKATLLCTMCGKSHVINSNEIICNKVSLRVIKEQSCNVAFKGDKICYKVSIYNESCLDLYDLDFIDVLDADIEYEVNSFYVNGGRQTPEINGRNLCYHINYLKAHEKLVLSFNVEVK